MVKVDVVTIFPRMVEAGLAEGVVGRARTAGLTLISRSIDFATFPQKFTRSAFFRLAVAPSR